MSAHCHWAGWMDKLLAFRRVTVQALLAYVSAVRHFRKRDMILWALRRSTNPNQDSARNAQNSQRAHNSQTNRINDSAITFLRSVRLHFTPCLLFCLSRHLRFDVVQLFLKFVALLLERLRLTVLVKPSLVCIGLFLG